MYYNISQRDDRFMDEIIKKITEIKKIIPDYLKDFNSATIKANESDTEISKKEFIKGKGLAKKSSFGDIPFPIVWFGDLAAYLKSKRKVLTIANNPSSAEFSNELRYFPNLKSDEYSDAEKLYDAFNGYFTGAYNSRWFGGINKALNEIKTSYTKSKKGKNTAIHIDFQSGIATDKWSGLKNKEKIQLANHNLFKELFGLLDPDVVVIFNDYFSMETLVRTINNGDFPEKKNWEIAENKNGFLVLGSFSLSGKNNRRKIVWVKNSQAPQTNLIGKDDNGNSNLKKIKKYLDFN